MVNSAQLINQSIFITTTYRATKPDRVNTFDEELPSIKSEELLIMWFWKVRWQTKYAISPVPQWMWLQNLTGWLYAMNRFFEKVAKYLDHAVLQSDVTSQKLYISITVRPLAINIENVMVYFKRFPPVKSYKLLIMWIFYVTWQIKMSLSSVPQFFETQKLLACWPRV